MSAELITSMSQAMIAIGVVVCLTLKFGMVAEYGRYTNASRSGLSPSLAWFIQEAPSFFIPFYYIFSSQNFCGVFLSGLFLIHYFNRVFIFPLSIRSTTVSPWYIMFSAIAFCMFNGFIQGAWNSQYQPCDESPLFYILGAIIFFTGMYINKRADQILFNLRKPGETGYKIPKGFLYEYISCPNYFGEIVEWTGYAIAARSLPAVAFAIFTAANIGPRALQHHAWYQEKFPEYPKNRKALIPYVL